jgi:hypothetical protein
LVAGQELGDADDVAEPGPIALKAWPMAGSNGPRAIGSLASRLRRILRAGLDWFLGPSSLAICLSLSGDAFCAGEVRRVLTEDLPSVGVGWATHPGGLAHVNPLL